MGIMLSLRDLEEAFAKTPETPQEVDQLAILFESRRSYLPPYQQAQFSRKLAQWRKMEEQSPPALPTFTLLPQAEPPKKPKPSVCMAPIFTVNPVEIEMNASYVYEGLDHDLLLSASPQLSCLTIRNTHDRRLELPICLGSLYLEDCSGLDLRGAAHQVRCSRLYNSKLQLYSASPIALEECEGVQIIPSMDEAPLHFAGRPNQAGHVINFTT